MPSRDLGRAVEAERVSPPWGVDLGGTKVEGAVFSVAVPSAGGRTVEGGEPAINIHARLRVPTESDRGYEHVLTRVLEVVERLERATGRSRPARLGVGAPGAERPDGTMKNGNTTSLNGRRLRDDLEQTLGTGVALANDADCFALAEATLGAGTGIPRRLRRDPRHRDRRRRHG